MKSIAAELHALHDRYTWLPSGEPTAEVDALAATVLK